MQRDHPNSDATPARGLPAQQAGIKQNDASRPLTHAIPPLEAARLALHTAEDTDATVATLPLDRRSTRDPDSPLYALGASHRGEHLGEIEAALQML